jgi:subtilisin family serine protease
MTATNPSRLHEILVACRRNLTDAQRTILERRFQTWGASNILHYIPSTAIYHLRLEPGFTATTFAHAARTFADIEGVEPVQDLDYATASTSGNVWVSPHHQLPAWWYELLNVERAHERTRGRGVLVALIDSGVAFHPELFSIDFPWVLNHCSHSRSPIFRTREFEDWSYGRWLIDEPDLFQRINLEQVQRNYKVWPTFSSDRLFVKIDILLGSYGLGGFSKAETDAMSDRVKSASKPSHFNLDDIANFARACKIPDAEVSSFVNAVLRETFENDWRSLNPKYRKLVLGDEMLLYKLLANSWTAQFDANYIPRVVHPRSGSKGNKDFADLDGHGTNVAGILFSAVTGICPEAGCLVCPMGRNSNTGALVRALEDAIAEKVQIVLVGAALQPGLIPGIVVTRQFEAAFKAGILVVVPSGNYVHGVSGLVELPHVLRVGSIMENGMPATSDIDPVDIWSYGGGDDPMTRPSVNRNEYRDYVDHSRIACLRIGGGFDFNAGSSIAAAQVAGVAALIKSAKPDADLAELRRLVLQCGKPHNVSPKAPPVVRTTGILDAGAVARIV